MHPRRSPVRRSRGLNQTLPLLPPASGQFQSIGNKIAELNRRVDAGEDSKKRSPKGKLAAGAMGLGSLGLLVWKFKFALTFVVTKGKLLLLGLTKLSTFTSMLVSMSVYWTVFGWKFAVGLVLSIYVHEMGHVVALRKFGIDASAPMFIPGIGAVIRARQHITDPIVDARVGLAGPTWGLGAAVACYVAFLLTGWGHLGAIARLGAWINLFNLIPVWQLDGARGFHALSRTQRWIVAAAFGAMWAVTSDGLIVLLAIVASVRALATARTQQGDTRTLVHFVALVIALGALCITHVPIPQ